MTTNAYDSFKTAPKRALRHHVTGAIERGEKMAIVEQSARAQFIRVKILLANDPHLEPILALSDEDILRMAELIRA